jgi:hydroxymethylpyrimidine pyrophosphatase-like HAD family hydrolase
MRYLALACDYDGTLAHHGQVDDTTLAALERLLASGRKLLLVTGRELDDLQKTFAHLQLFEWIIVENGAHLYRPGSRETILLGERPPERFIQALKERGVPVSVGNVIVATWHPHETAVLEIIRDLGLELQVTFNKGAVMVLPANINKATGLAAALKGMGLSPHNVVGVGDAENDHAFLSLCECAATVANALPALKEHADIITRGDHGAGVAELIEGLIASDLRDLEGRLTRHHLLLGTRPSGEQECIKPYGTNVLIAGPSGSGKSTVATGLLERLGQHAYQFCIIDPEGDYEGFEGAVVLGNAEHAPTQEEVLQVLKKPDANIVVNLIGLSVTDRPTFFMGLLPRLQEMRVALGRPHWLVVDDAHHLLPASWEPAALVLPQQLDQLLLITVHPGEVSPAVLKWVDTIIAVGPAPGDTLAEFGAAVGEKAPDLPDRAAEAEEVVVWLKASGVPPHAVRPAPSQTERRRHIRKYAAGELPPERSFFFRGPEGKLNLRAQNLILFLQLAEGVDDATWTHHLRQGDYSAWLRTAIKDEGLASEVAAVEASAELSAAESRRLVRAAIEKHYTLPAAAVLPMPGTDAEPRFS